MAHVRVVRNGSFIAAIATLLVACGGGDSPTAATPIQDPPAPPAPEVVTGVATPDSVAVVTATNAN